MNNSSANGPIALFGKVAFDGLTGEVSASLVRPNTEDAIASAFRDYNARIAELARQYEGRHLGKRMN